MTKSEERNLQYLRATLFDLALILISAGLAFACINALMGE